MLNLITNENQNMPISKLERQYDKHLFELLMLVGERDYAAYLKSFHVIPKISYTIHT